MQGTWTAHQPSSLRDLSVIRAVLNIGESAQSSPICAGTFGAEDTLCPPAGTPKAVKGGFDFNLEDLGIT